MDFKLLNIRIMFKDETDAERFRDKIFELVKYYDVEWIDVSMSDKEERKEEVGIMNVSKGEPYPFPY